MIMTAGLGTRLRPFTSLTSKPLLPILSVPTIHLVCDHLAAMGVTRSVCNLHSHPEETRRGIEEYDRDMSFGWSDERKQILGSWGGVVTAASKIQGERFYWINGDVITNLNLLQLEQTHLRLKSRHPKLEMTLLLTRSGKSEAKYREMSINSNTGLITKAGELGSDVLFYASSAIIETESLSRHKANVPLDFVKEYLLAAIQRGVVGFCEQKKDIWIDIGSAALWAEAHFEMIKLLESEALPTYWEERLMGMNEKVSNGVWKLFDLEIPDGMKLKEPLYLGSGDYEWNESLQFGPRLVLYGLAASEAVLSDKIVYSGMSSDFSK